MENSYGRFKVYENFLGPRSSDTVLSVGCHHGIFEAYLSRKVKKVHAVDINEEEIRANMKKYPQVEFRAGDLLEGLDFPDGLFDKIIFTEVLEHLPRGREKEALHELHRLLSPGGILVLSTPNDHPLATFSDPAWLLKGHRHYRPEAVLDLLRSAGFRADGLLIGGAHLQTLLISPLYLLCVLRLYRHLEEDIFEKVVASEYEKPGYWTIIVKAKKPKK